MGYLETEFAPSIQLGIPRPLQTVFLLETALSLIKTNLAVARVRKILCILDQIETKLVEAVCQVGVSELGNLKLHPLAGKGILGSDSIEKEYQRWAFRLADVLGAPPYPYAQRFRKSGPGSNVRVN
jgi:hypothetical protein